MSNIFTVPCYFSAAIKGCLGKDTVYCFHFVVGITLWHVHIYAGHMNKGAAMAYRATALRQAWEHMNMQLEEHGVQIAPYDEGDITYV